MKLADQLAEARALVALLERQAAGATCAEIGHDWKCLGGCNCGCHEDASCSVPVNECARCKDCDYGDNNNAREVRRRCQFSSPARGEAA
jgi:hypothetical protein